MKFLITNPDGRREVLDSEAGHANAAAIMHWGKATALEVWQEFKVLIEPIVDVVRNGAHYVEAGVHEVLGHLSESDTGEDDGPPPEPQRLHLTTETVAVVSAPGVVAQATATAAPPATAPVVAIPAQGEGGGEGAPQESTPTTTETAAENPVEPVAEGETQSASVEGA